MPNYDIARDAHGHILNRQVWVHGAAVPITLHLAHPGITIATHIQPPNLFFMRHFLLPSGKVGVTLKDKADHRLTHRQGGQADVKLKEAVDKGSAWAVAQPGDDAATDQNVFDFFAGLQGVNHNAYLGGLPNADDWKALRPELLTAIGLANPKALTHAKALASLLNNAANKKLSNSEALRVRTAFQALVDPLRGRAGMSWNAKYGDGAPPENTVIVLADGKGVGWQANTLPPACQPITRAAASQAFVQALTVALGAKTAFPEHLKASVDFGQPCVLATKAGSFSNTFKFEAYACSATDFDIYHFDPK